jgi:sugar phosphate permease
VAALLAFWSKRSAIGGIVVAMVSWLLGFIPISEDPLLTVLVPGATTAYIAIAIAVIGAVITYARGGEATRFEGIPEDEKMIAEIEKQYDEGD